MIHHPTNKELYLLITVPENLSQPHFQTEKTIRAMLNNSDEGNELVIRHVLPKCGSPKGKHVITLPPGKWQLIGLASDLTDAEKEGLLKRRGNFGSLSLYELMPGCLTAVVDKAFASFLNYHNLTASRTVILKQNKQTIMEVEKSIHLIW